MLKANNPILSGFHPDPSILRVGEDYFLATSTFQWFGGVALYHSRDLVNWQELPTPLNRRSQLDMSGNPNSGGIWAPCLSFCDGVYYLIFTNVKNNKLGFQHLCESIEDTLHYPSSRIIMIFAAFEREYRNVYGVDSERSQEYIDTKNEVIAMIDQYTNTLHGKKRAYSKQLRKYVLNRDSSFEFNLKKALSDCKDIMVPFVRNKYSGTYDDAINGVCERMGAVRNGIAHSRLDLRFDAIHLSDIKIVEELLYAIRLKQCDIETEKIQKSINDIFRENIAI
jgi:hypothetical protein